MSNPKPSSAPAPTEVDPETGTDPEGAPIDNPSGVARRLEEAFAL